MVFVGAVLRPMLVPRQEILRWAVASRSACSATPAFLFSQQIAPSLRRDSNRARLHTSTARHAASHDTENIASGNAAAALKPPEGQASQASNASKGQSVDEGVVASYAGPLAKTFFRLKMFSLGSLALSTALCPALLLAPAEVSIAGRLGLCAVALATSSASTTLIGWIGAPYASKMALLSPQAAQERRSVDIVEAALQQEDVSNDVEYPAIEATTFTWRLQLLRTTIYDPTFLRGTSRPFATWELAAKPAARALPENVAHATKLVAVTRDAKSGKIMGTRWASWSAETLTRVPEGASLDATAGAKAGQFIAEGKTIQQGHVPRYLSVHEDLLDNHWQIV